MNDEHKVQPDVDNMNIVKIAEVTDEMTGISPPFTVFPGRNDTAGVAARAALLRFADIIAHEDMHSANGLRKLVLDIENELGRVTQ